jgi:S-adenosyl methyltransferase
VELKGVARDPGERDSLDTNVPHIARVYNYWLGGKDNFAADRELAEKFVALDPQARAGVRSNRAFLGRAIEYLAGEAGVRQFLDIGTGIPTADNTHEVAQRVAPQSRIVYVDNDPIVLTHARALLASSPAGATDYIDADLRDTPAILRNAAQTLDFAAPIAIVLVGVLHCIPDAADPWNIVDRLIAGVPSGSWVAISHPASDIHAREMAAGAAMMNRSLAAPVTFRPREQVMRFFDGVSLVEPGLVSTTQWRPRPGADTTPLPGWVGVAQKQ